MAYDYSQIYNLVNAVSDEAYGESAISVKDTESLVSLGNQVFKSDEDLDAFYKALPVVIGRVITWLMEVQEHTRGIQVNELTFGAILERITVYKIARAEQNTSWTNQANPFAKTKDDTDINVQLMSKIAGWELDKIVYDKQLRPAFANASRMAAFVEMVFRDMYNGMTGALNACAALTECTAIAQVANSGGAAQFVNLLTLYNATHTPIATVAAAREDSDFLKWAAKKIKRTISMMTDRVSTLYNVAGAEREIRASDLRIHMLSDFAGDLAFYLNADTYHNEFVEVTGYEEVSAWQGSDTDDEFENVSKIHIENGEDIPETELDGIVCTVFHSQKMGCMIRDIRTKSMYNGKSECTNYYHKADIGYYITPDMPMVVFYMADEDFTPTELDEGEGE